MALKFEVLDFTKAIADSNRVISNLDELSKKLKSIQGGDSGVSSKFGKELNATADEVRKLAEVAKVLNSVLTNGQYTLTKYAAISGQLGAGVRQSILEIEKQASAYNLLRKELVGRTADIKKLEGEIRFLSSQDGAHTQVLKEKIKALRELNKVKATADATARASASSAWVGALSSIDKDRESQKQELANLRRYIEERARLEKELQRQRSSASREMKVTGLPVAFGHSVMDDSQAKNIALQRQAEEQVKRYNEALIKQHRAEDTLTAAKRKLREGTDQLTAAEAKAIYESRSRTEEVRRLNDALIKQNVVEDTLTAAKRKLREGTEQLTAAEAKAIYESRSRTEEVRRLNDALIKQNVVEDTLTAAKRKLREGTEQLTAAEAKAVNQEREQLASVRSLNDELLKRTQTVDALTSGLRKLQEGTERLTAAEAKAVAESRSKVEQLRRENEATISLYKADHLLLEAKRKLQEGTERLTAAEAKAIVTREKEIETTRRANEATLQMQRSIIGNHPALLKLGTSLFHVTERMARFSKVTNLAAQTTAGMRAGLNAAGSHMGIFTSSTILTATAVYGLVAAMRNTISTGSEFTGQMARSLAVMNTTADQTEVMTTKVRQLAQDTVFTATEVSQGLLYLGMAGLTTAEASLALEPALKLASIGMIDMSRSADIATNIMSAFNIDAADFTHVVDDMATAVTSSNMDIEQLGNALSYVGPIAHEAGLSLQETIASLEVLHNNGIKASRAGTAMRKSLLSLMAPSAEASAVLLKTGIAVTDAEGRMKPFVNVLGQIASAMEAGKMATKDVEQLVGVRATAGFLKLIDAAKESKGELAAYTDQLYNNADAAEYLQQRIENYLGGDWKKLVAAVQEKALQLYDRWEATLRRWVTSATDWVKHFDVNKLYEMTKPIQYFGDHLERVLETVLKIGAALKGASWGASIGGTAGLAFGAPGYAIGTAVGATVGAGVGYYTADNATEWAGGFGGGSPTAGRRYEVDVNAPTQKAIDLRIRRVEDLQSQLKQAIEAQSKLAGLDQLLSNSTLAGEARAGVQAARDKIANRVPELKAQLAEELAMVNQQAKAYSYINIPQSRSALGEFTPTVQDPLGQKNTAVAESVSDVIASYERLKGNTDNDIDKVNEYARTLAEIKKYEAILYSQKDGGAGNLAAAAFEELKDLQKARKSQERAVQSFINTESNKLVNPLGADADKYKAAAEKWSSKAAREEEARRAERTRSYYDNDLKKAEQKLSVLEREAAAHNRIAETAKAHLSTLDRSNAADAAAAEIWERYIVALEQTGQAMNLNIDAVKRYIDQRKELSFFEREFKSTVNTLRDMGDEVGQLDSSMSSWITGVSDSFHTFVMTGKASFKDLANSILSDLARIAANKATASLFNFAMDVALSFVPGVPAGTGSAISSGVNANKGYVPKNRAAGGSMIGGQQYLVGELGPELFTPSVSGAHKLTPTHQLTSAQNNITIQVNVDAKGNSSESSKGSNDLGTQLAKNVRNIVKETIANEQRSGGLLDARRRA